VTGATTAGFHPASVQLDELADDREPQAETRARHPFLTLPVGLEHVRKQLGRDAVTFVAHGDPRGGARGVERDANGGATVAVLDGVADEIRDDLLKARGVAVDPWARRREVGDDLDAA